MTHTTKLKPVTNKAITIPFTEADHERLTRLSLFFREVTTLFASSGRNFDGPTIESILRPAADQFDEFDNEILNRFDEVRP